VELRFLGKVRYADKTHPKEQKLLTLPVDSFFPRGAGICRVEADPQLTTTVRSE
jgi:hypothetical protein